MKFLTFLFSLLLVVTLVPAGLLVVVDRTVSADYVGSVLERTNAYSELSTLIPGVVADQASDGDAAEKAKIEAGLTKALTPDFLKTTLTGALTQFESVLKGDGRTVTIPLSDVGVRARAAGLEVKDEQFKDVVLGPDKLAKASVVTHNTLMAKTWALEGTAVMLVLGLFVAWWRRSYGAMGWALMQAGLLMAAFLAALVFIPGLLLSKLDFSGPLATLSPLIHKIVGLIVSDLRLDFGVMVAVLMVAGLVLVLFGKFLPGRGPAPMPRKMVTAAAKGKKPLVK